jgi:hypothetical protein
MILRPNAELVGVMSVNGLDVSVQPSPDHMPKCTPDDLSESLRNSERYSAEVSQGGAIARAEINDAAPAANFRTRVSESCRGTPVPELRTRRRVIRAPLSAGLWAVPTRQFVPGVMAAFFMSPILRIHLPGCRRREAYQSVTASD